MPLNTSAATAIAVSLPHEVTVDPEGELELWWKYTAAAGEVVIGVYAYAEDGPATTLTVWTGEPGSLTRHLSSSDLNANNAPASVPVTPGTTYHVKVARPSGAGPFALSFIAGPQEAIPPGALLINDDRGGFPAVILSPDDGEPLRHVNFVVSEYGGVLQTGEYLFATGAPTLHRYTKAFAADGTIPIDLLGYPTVATDRQGRFYVATAGSETPGGPGQLHVYVITRTGSVEDEWTIPGDAFFLSVPITVANDGSKLYAGIYGDSGGEVLVYDAAGGALTSFYIGGDDVVPTGLVTVADGTLLVQWLGPPGDVDLVTRHATDASVLRTYPITGRYDRIAQALDPGEFWIWSKVNVGGTWRSRFERVNVESGEVVNAFQRHQFERGVGPAGLAAAAPRFGNADSCPLVIVPPAVVVVSAPAFDESRFCPPPKKCPPGTAAAGSQVRNPPRGVAGRIPPAANIAPTSGARTPTSPAYWSQECTGGGAVPTAPDPVDYEDWR